MNRILFEPTEIHDGIALFGDARAAHVRDVLHGAVGQILKTGVLDGPVGTSEILSVGPEIAVRVDHAQASLQPWADLILAPPRPRVMKRLLPQLAALGVGRIVLVGAQKVEKAFWGATVLKSENYRPLLVDGLMQHVHVIVDALVDGLDAAGDQHLPVEIPRLVHARERLQLLDQQTGFLFRDEL